MIPFSVAMTTYDAPIQALLSTLVFSYATVSHDECSGYSANHLTAESVKWGAEEHRDATFYTSSCRCFARSPKVTPRHFATHLGTLSSVFSQLFCTVSINCLWHHLPSFT